MQNLVCPPLPVRVIKTGDIKNGSPEVRFVVTEEGKRMFAEKQPFYSHLFGVDPRQTMSLNSLFGVHPDDSSQLPLSSGQLSMQIVRRNAHIAVARRMRFLFVFALSVV